MSCVTTRIFDCLAENLCAIMFRVITTQGEKYEGEVVERE